MFPGRQLKYNWLEMGVLRQGLLEGVGWSGLESVCGNFRLVRCGLAGQGAVVEKRESVSTPPRGPTGSSNIPPYIYIYKYMIQDIQYIFFIYIYMLIVFGRHGF